MSELTDFELDKAIAEIIYPDNVIYEQIGNARVQDPDGDDFYVSYCYDWNDLMPLIENHCLKYEIFNRGKYFLVRLVSINNGYSNTERATTLTRATAQCLLKVLESKK